MPILQSQHLLPEQFLAVNYIDLTPDSQKAQHPIIRQASLCAKQAHNLGSGLLRKVYVFVTEVFPPSYATVFLHLWYAAFHKSICLPSVSSVGKLVPPGDSDSRLYSPAQGVEVFFRR